MIPELPMLGSQCNADEAEKLSERKDVGLSHQNFRIDDFTFSS